MTKTLREERREEMLQGIKHLAWQQMANNGPADLSLRAIARQMRVSSAAIYRYFENRDALLTELCKDAYQHQVAALNALPPIEEGEDATHRILQLSRLYRQWSHQNPEKFALIYGTPVPGFHQPWPILSPYAIQVMDIFLESFEQAYLQYKPELPVLPEELSAQLAGIVAYRKYNVAPAVLYLTLEGWTRLHGFISLELIDQLCMFPNIDAFFEYTMHQIIQHAGFEVRS